MDKWGKLKELYKWKIKNIESNPEPITWDKYDKKHYEHVLTEMERIEDAEKKSRPTPPQPSPRLKGRIRTPLEKHISMIRRH